MGCLFALIAVLSPDTGSFVIALDVALLRTPRSMTLLATATLPLA